MHVNRQPRSGQSDRMVDGRDTGCNATHAETSPVAKTEWQRRRRHQSANARQTSQTGMSEKQFKDFAKKPKR